MPTPEENKQQPEAAMPAATPKQDTPQAPQAQAAQPTAEKPAQAKEQAAPKKGPTASIPQDERLLAASSYIPFLPFMGFVMKPQSKFCQMHGRQGVMTSVLFVAVLMFLLIFGGFFIFQILGSLIFLAYVVLIGIAAFQAFSGIKWEIPVLYALSSKMTFIDSLFMPSQSTDQKSESEEAPTQKAEEKATPKPEPAKAPTAKSPQSEEPQAAPAPQPTQPTTEAPPQPKPAETPPTEEPNKDTSQNSNPNPQS